jgi:hypothetical protein
VSTAIERLLSGIRATGVIGEQRELVADFEARIRADERERAAQIAETSDFPLDKLYNAGRAAAARDIRRAGGGGA